MNYEESVEAQNEQLSRTISEMGEELNRLAENDARFRIIILELLHELHHHHPTNGMTDERVDSRYRKTKEDVAGILNAHLKGGRVYNNHTWDCLKDYFNMLGVEMPDAKCYELFKRSHEVFDLPSF
jgi:hypothetical protein